MCLVYGLQNAMEPRISPGKCLFACIFYVILREMTDILKISGYGVPKAALFSRFWAYTFWAELERHFLNRQNWADTFWADKIDPTLFEPSKSSRHFWADKIESTLFEPTKLSWQNWAGNFWAYGTVFYKNRLVNVWSFFVTKLIIICDENWCFAAPTKVSQIKLGPSQITISLVTNLGQTIWRRLPQTRSRLG